MEHNNPSSEKLTWLSTKFGNKIYPADFVPENYSIADFTASLFVMPRFLGHTNFIISVGTHEVLTCLATWKATRSPQAALCALHHDDSEAILADIPTGVKNLPEMDGYRILEKRIQDACWEAVGIPFPQLYADEVHAADKKMCDLELLFRSLSSHSKPSYSMFFLTKTIDHEMGLYMKIHDTLTSKTLLPPEIDDVMDQILTLVECVIDSVNTALSIEMKKNIHEKEMNEFMEKMAKVAL